MVQLPVFDRARPLEERTIVVEQRPGLPGTAAPSLIERWEVR